jgi:hypothetical protein
MKKETNVPAEDRQNADAEMMDGTRRMVRATNDNARQSQRVKRSGRDVEVHPLAELDFEKCREDAVGHNS